jgi:Tfp pilus assembly protein PilF
MLMSVLVLAAALGPQATEGVQAADLPAGDPAAAQAAIDAGLAAFKKRRFARAEIEFRKALEAAPGSAAPHFYLGYTYYKMGEPRRRLTPEKEKAKELFAKAFELDPAFRPVWGEAAPPKK